MKKPDHKLPPIAILAETAFKEAVAEVIEDHRRTGDPIAIWRNGKVVLLPVDQIPVRKSRTEEATVHATKTLKDAKTNTQEE